jgi:hypothetical protein
LNPLKHYQKYRESIGKINFNYDGYIKVRCRKLEKG